LIYYPPTAARAGRGENPQIIRFGQWREVGNSSVYISSPNNAMKLTENCAVEYSTWRLFTIYISSGTVSGVGVVHSNIVHQPQLIASR
jgi:hypothetical protein